MIDSNSEEIFYRQINPLTADARAALEDATNRHNEILKLERSISELNDLFVDVYELVALQDGLVNNIAKNVEAATEYTAEAHRNVVQAVTYKQRAQRKTCMLIIVGVAILVALLVLVLILVLGK
jgi:syntaxin 1B/2/3